MEEQTISRNIKSIRKKRGLTLTEVAQKAGITKSNLSKIENGHISTPIATLIRIAEVLDIPMSNFFLEEETDPPYVITRKGEGRVFAREGAQFGYAYQSLSQGMRNKKMEPFLLTLPPQAVHEDTFQHEGEEFIYVLSGKIEFIIDGDELVLETGDSILFDSHKRHVGKSLDNSESTLVCVFLQPK